jgi:Tfp pilus assembly protein PilF
MATAAQLFQAAVRAHQLGNLAQAEAFYQGVLQADARHAEAHHYLGLVALQTGRQEAGLQWLRRALDLNPANVQAHYNLGNLYAGLSRFAEAAKCYEQVVRLNPRHADALNNLGIVLKEQGRLLDAIDYFRQALAINPQHADALTNLGLYMAQQGQFAAAADSYEKALRINPRHRMALGNRSLLRLLQGDFAAAWPDFEQRWARPGIVPRTFAKPHWDGSALQGKTILVYEEQGLGDTIQFARYLPMVRERGGKVVFECPRALTGLFAGFDGVDQLIPTGTPLPGFDVVMPLMSLPGVFGTTLETIPAAVPYLRRAIRLKRATPRAAEIDVGIVWQGSLNCQGDQRSVSLRLFEPLSRLKNVRLRSLQVKPGSDQLRTISFPVTDVGNKFNPDSLDHLSTALSRMDLVITVDTSAAHLAGALGVPVWVLLPVVPDWRWLLERTDSPWYPTMRLFRQRRFGEWDDVFQNIATELRSFQPGSANRG